MKLKSYSSLLPVFAAILLTFVCSLAPGFLTGVKIPLLFALIWICLSNLLSIFLVTLIHELGHLVFGLISGYRLQSFQVLFWKLDWTKNGWKWEHCNARMALGQCLMAPPDYREGRFPFLLYNLGGVIFNAACFLLFSLTVWFDYWKVIRQVFGWPWMFFAFSICMAGWSLYAAINNGIPKNNKFGLSNDANTVQAVLKSPQAKAGYWLLLKNSELDRLQIPYTKRPKEYGYEIENIASASYMELAPNLIYETRLLNELNFEAAAIQAKRLLEAKGMSVLGLGSLKLDLAVCKLAFKEDEEARQLYDSAPAGAAVKMAPDHPDVLSSLYFYHHWLEKDENAASKWLNRLKESSWPEKHQLQSAFDRIEAIEKLRNQPGHSKSGKTDSALLADKRESHAGKKKRR